MVTAAGHLGGGAAAVTAFAAAMVIFALGECLLSPTLPAIINDLAPPGAAGRYKRPRRTGLHHRLPGRPRRRRGRTRRRLRHRLQPRGH
jgi:hypothetical protein